MLTGNATYVLAIVVLAAIALALVVWIFRIYRGTHYTPMQFPLYMLSRFLARVLWRAEVRGELELPADRGAVIVCNHRSPIDPSFIGLMCNRPVRWMVAKEYFGWPGFGWMLRTVWCIPTSRGGVDTAATKLAVRYAQQGDVVGLFPEGRINNTEQFMLPGRPGAAMIALKAKVPVIPCYVQETPYDGTVWGFLFKPAKAKLIVGKPIDLSEYHNGEKATKEEMAELTLRFMREIANLAGRSDFEPQLAGRNWKPGKAPATSAAR